MATEKKTLADPLADQAKKQAERPEHLLIEEAAKAIECFDEDDLERFAKEQEGDGS